MASSNKKMQSILEYALNHGYEPVPGYLVQVINMTLQNNSASYCNLIVQKPDSPKLHKITIGLNDILFDHAFAKALWGTDNIDVPTPIVANDEVLAMPMYKFNLWQLAMLESIQGRLSFIVGTLPNETPKRSKHAKN